MNTNGISLFLMANLGSEATRLLVALDEENSDRAAGAYKRFKGILNELTALPSMKSREKELNVLENVVDDMYLKSGKYNVSEQSLKNYFFPFAERALRKLR